MEDKKVKMKNAMKAALLIFNLIAAISFSSCSSMLLHRGQTVDSAQSGENIAAAPSVMVPKEQYDELARKYQELLTLSKQKKLSDAPQDIVKEEVKNEHIQTKPELGMSSALDPSELVNHIDKAIPDSVITDSIDSLQPEAVIEKAQGPKVPSSLGIQEVNSTDDIDDQISKLREVQEMIKVNKFENALTILKELEQSKEKQIVVRAKIMLGDLLFNQGEYDLASQVYEEVVKKYAFSGYVLKALGKLVSCSEKLKQPEKQAKYYSLLHDFFEAT